MYAIDELRLMSGIDIPVINFQEVLHQPKISEIAFMGQNDFFYCVSFISSSNGKDLSEKMEKEKGLKIEFTDYEAFTQMFFTEEKNNTMIFNSFFSLLFPTLKAINWNQYQTTFMFNNKNIILDNENFSELKYIILRMTGMDKVVEKNEFNTTTDRAAKIAEKIKKHRQIVAKEKANMSDDNGEEDMLTNMVSCMSTVSGLNISDILNYTYYQLIKQYQRALLYDGYKTQMSMSAFGGVDAEKVIDWQKNI